MRCMFCLEEMIAKTNHCSGEKGVPITLPGRGVAHSFCAERDLIERRVFCNIHLSDLPINDLYELRELVLSEINEREGHSDDTVDLF